MTTHVFIVDSTTFRYHLEHLFTGTGAKTYRIDFNSKSKTKLSWKTENLLVAMIADANRIRKGDLIIFYLQRNPKDKIPEGKFYGIFKAKDDGSFLDNNDRSQYLKSKLKKSLTFRTLIEPYKVYPAGVTEWDALDEIKLIQRPYQMLWSLIYRKLKANRGNTMITAYESKILCKLIRNKNQSKNLFCNNKLLSFDLEEQNIICIDEPPKSYSGRTEDIKILPRLLQKFKEGKSFEPHLQAYIVKNIGKKVNSKLDKCILGKGVIKWTGNEVSCGVGMQRIDVLLSAGKSQQTVIPIELKTRNANEQNVAQIQRYIDWVEQYYIPNCPSRIQPVLICRKIARKTKKDDSLSSRYKKLTDTFHDFNQINKRRCCRLKYLEFCIENENLVFNEESY